VEQIFGHGEYKKNAGKIAEGFKRCTGAKGAADKIIKVCIG